MAAKAAPVSGRGFNLEIPVKTGQKPKSVVTYSWFNIWSVILSLLLEVNNV